MLFREEEQLGTDFMHIPTYQAYQMQSKPSFGPQKTGREFCEFESFRRTYTSVFRIFKIKLRQRKHPGAGIFILDFTPCLSLQVS